MADLRISQLPALPQGALAADDVLPITDVSASETKKVTSADLVKSGINRLPDGSIPLDKVDIQPGSLNGDGLEQNSITGGATGAIALNTITADNMADGAIVDAAVASVSGAKITDGTVSDAKLGTGLSGAKLTDSSVSDAKLATGIDGTKLSNGSVADGKLATGIDGAKLQDASVTDQQIGGVSGAKIADGSIADVKISGVAGGKISNGTVTDAKLATGIDGGKLTAGTVTNAALATGIDGSKITPGTIDTDQLGQFDGDKITQGTLPPNRLEPGKLNRNIGLDANGNLGITNNVVAGTMSGISYNSSGLVTGTVPLEGTDLPPATTDDLGGVSVPVERGLDVTATGQIGMRPVVAPGTVSGISVNQFGQVVAIEPLEGADMPIASDTEVGGVSIPPGGKFAVNETGQLSHVESPAGLGPFTKVTLDATGHVVAGASLGQADIPGLNADNITSGQFSTARLQDDAVTMPKLADFSVSFIQESQPALTTDLHIGCLWYQESSAQLRMYNGNSFMPVGFGRLSQENLRFGGTINADTGLLVALTDAGRTAGLEIGSELPAATDALGGLYVVVSDPGNNISVVPLTGFDAGDWCLCVNGTEGWIRIDTLNGGGGGGGGLIRLNDLLDVDINNPGAGDTLVFDPTTGQWTNRTTTADRVTMSPAFDGMTTAFTLSMDIVDQNNVLLSVSGVIMEPGVDFQIASGTRDINFATPPPEGSPYFLLNQQTVNASGDGGGGGGGGTELPPGTAANELLQWNNTLGTWGPTTFIDGGTF